MERRRNRERESRLSVRAPLTANTVPQLQMVLQVLAHARRVGLDELSRPSPAMTTLSGRRPTPASRAGAIAASRSRRRQVRSPSARASWIRLLLADDSIARRPTSVALRREAARQLRAGHIPHWSTVGSAGESRAAAPPASPAPLIDLEIVDALIVAAIEVLDVLAIPTTCRAAAAHRLKDRPG